MNQTAKIPRVAIACQGGGSHAAFCAGVLLELLRPQHRERYELVALSGTSGGAISAALVWRGLVASGVDEASERLSAFWRGLIARDPVDLFVAFWDVWLARLPVLVNAPPYLAEPLAEPTLRALLRSHLDLDHLATDPARRASPQLFVGATDVMSGQRVIFRGEELGYDHLVASAAVPPLFRAVEASGHLCWDGLFTSNPPVREFTDLPEPPDELWVIQINPQHRRREPRSMREIKDRSNELSGNLSLGQELYFIDKINHLLEAHPSLAERYRPIRIRVVQMDHEGLDYPSKLERREHFIEALLKAGRERADWFFDSRSDWPREATIPATAQVLPFRRGNASAVATPASAKRATANPPPAEAPRDAPLDALPREPSLAEFPREPRVEPPPTSERTPGRGKKPRPEIEARRHAKGRG